METPLVAMVALRLAPSTLVSCVLFLENLARPDAETRFCPRLLKLAMMATRSVAMDVPPIVPSNLGGSAGPLVLLVLKFAVISSKSEKRNAMTEIEFRATAVRRIVPTKADGSVINQIARLFVEMA